MALGPETETKGVNRKATAQKRRAESVHPFSGYASGSYIYFIQAKSGGLVKIGFAKDPATRLRDMQSGCPIPLAILATCRGGQMHEGSVHYRFRAHRAHGEWFAPVPELLAFVAEVRAGAEPFADGIPTWGLPPPEMRAPANPVLKPGRYQISESGEVLVSTRVPFYGPAEA